MPEKIEKVVTAEALHELAAFWEDPWPGFDGRMPTRIAATSFDQQIPDGVNNPYWEIARQVPIDVIDWRYQKRPHIDGHYFHPSDPKRMLVSRTALTRSYSWSICSPGDVAWITSRLEGRKVVEIGAGGGYWAWQLAQAGVDVAAYDPQPVPSTWALRSWYPVRKGGPTSVSRYPKRSLLLCWPSYSEGWAGTTLARYQGDQLFYVGEGEGGCCADEGFFRLLHKEWTDTGDSVQHITYAGIHCYLTEYRRGA